MNSSLKMLHNTWIRNGQLVIIMVMVLFVFYLSKRTELPFLNKETGTAMTKLYQKVRGYSSNLRSHLREYLAKGIRYHPLYLRHNTSSKILDADFHRFLIAPEVICEDSFRAGHVGDGGWDVCMSGPYLPKKPCLVYSFGINYDFSFDDAVANKFQCSVKSYDPSMKKVEDHRRGSHIDFYKKGLSGTNTVHKGWPLFTFKTLLKQESQTDAIIDYFKMDIEWSEWSALPNMAATGTLRNIKQMGLEIHRPVGATTKVFNLIMILHNHGFRKWKMHYNTNCQYKLPDKKTLTSQCIEIYFLNMNFLELETIH